MFRGNIKRYDKPTKTYAKNNDHEKDCFNRH